MSIKDFLLKIKPFYNLVVILLVASIFFALGRLSALEEARTPIKIQYPEVSQAAGVSGAVLALPGKTAEAGKETMPTGGAVIGSKSGKKYYFPWCGTVKRIKPENQVHFASIEEARSAGFLPGGNCKGLK